MALCPQPMIWPVLMYAEVINQLVTFHNKIQVLKFLKCVHYLQIFAIIFFNIKEIIHLYFK